MVRVHENHCITDDTTDLEQIPAVYMKKYDKYLIFCKCGEIVRVKEDPDNTRLCCDNEENDYWVSTLKSNGNLIEY